MCVCVFFFCDRQKERASIWLNTCQISAVDLQYIFLFMISCTLAITKRQDIIHMYFTCIFFKTFRSGKVVVYILIS